MPKAKKKTKTIKKHHKIHLSYIVAIIIIIIAAGTVFSIVKNNKQSPIIREVYYKEVTDAAEPEIEINTRSAFIDESCDLGEKLQCESFEIKGNEIRLWVSHREQTIEEVIIKSPTCNKDSSTSNFQQRITHTFVLEDCDNDIADSKGLIEIPLLISFKGDDESTEIGKISTAIQQ